MASQKAKIKNIRQKTFYNTRNPEYLIYEQNIPYAKYLVSRIFDGFPRKKRSSLEVLEIGAGQGRFTFELAQHVRNIHATDLSKKEIQTLDSYIKSFGTKNIMTSVYDVLVQSSSLTKKKYDVIVSFFTIHHIHSDEYSTVVKHLKSLLKPGGRLVCIEPNSLYPGHLVEIVIKKDMHWNIEKQIYSRYISTFCNVCECFALVQKKRNVFGCMPPPIINRMPESTLIDKGIEQIPWLKHILCPFVLLSFEKKS